MYLPKDGILRDCHDFRGGQPHMNHVCIFSESCDRKSQHFYCDPYFAGHPCLGISTPEKLSEVHSVGKPRLFSEVLKEYEAEIAARVKK